MSRLVLTQITIKKERSISSTTWYYLLQPSNASAPDTTDYGNPPPTYSNTGYSGWSTTEPTYTIGDNRVLYVMVQTLYSDGTFSYSTPTISSSYEAAKDAYNEVIEAETTISEFEDLGLKQGYIWDNMTYVAAHDNIPEYPVGSYIASGYLNAGSRSINRANSNTYGLNTWISTGGIKLRYNAINLMQLTTSNLEFYYPSTSSQQKKAISLGTNNAVNSLAFYGFNNDNKTMELTNSALTLYNPTDGTTEQAVLDTNGLVLQKGGIKAGNITAGNNGYVYLSTENHSSYYALTTDTEIDSNKIYYTYNSNTGVYTEVETPAVSDINSYYELIYPSVNNVSKNNWRQLIGSKFGVDSEGNLYATNVNLTGEINATKGVIGKAIIDEDGNLIVDTANIAHGAITVEELNIGEYIQFLTEIINTEERPKLVLGGENSSFKIELTNEKLSFNEGGIEVAYMNGQKLYITKSVVLQQMDVGMQVSQGGLGQWSWKIHEVSGQNNLYLKWLG